MVLNMSLVFFVAIVLALSLIDGPYPHDQVPQHIVTLAGLVLWVIAIRKSWIGGASCLLIALFLCLHILGARYVYSFVPYDLWCEQYLGFTPSETFRWQRNHYDRLVHFFFGLLMLSPIAEGLEKRGRLSSRWSLAFSLITITTLSATYEIIEWLVAILMSPQRAETYNGQQGDFFDAQKDMALALVGSLIALAFIAQRGCLKKKTQVQEID